MFNEWMRGKLDKSLLSVMGASLTRCLDRLTNLRVQGVQECSIPCFRKISKILNQQ